MAQTVATLYKPAALPPDEPKRLAALARYGILDTPPEPAFDRLTTLAAQMFAAPISVISLIDTDRQWLKSRHGIDIHQTSRDIAFCAHAILTEGVCLVPDARYDPRFAAHPLVVGGPGIRFYAGAPLTTPDGFRLGTLCVVDTEPRQDFDAAARANLERLAAIAVDELELRLAVGALSAAHERAEAASEAKSLLLARVTHELRTPLSTILGFAELLDHGLSQNLVCEPRWAQNIHRSGEYLLGLVDDLLDMSRLAGGQYRPVVRPVPAERLAETAMASVSALAQQAGVRVQADIAPGCPPVQCDETAAVRVVVKLLSNAIRFGGGRPVRLMLWPEDGMMRIAVADQGAGMTAAQIDKAVEAFGQVDDGLDRGAEGGGLGLSLARAFMQAHGGTLGIASVPGQGTTVTAAFPLR